MISVAVDELGNWAMAAGGFGLLEEYSKGARYIKQLICEPSHKPQSPENPSNSGDLGTDTAKSPEAGDRNPCRPESPEAGTGIRAEPGRKSIVSAKRRRDENPVE
jgi:hypothetical protein